MESDVLVALLFWYGDKKMSFHSSMKGHLMTTLLCAMRRLITESYYFALIDL